MKESLGGLERSSSRPWLALPKLTEAAAIVREVEGDAIAVAGW